jgi:regulator of protease activity HflC (stomatin/prohibitin superfamily)
MEEFAELAKEAAPKKGGRRAGSILFYLRFFLLIVVFLLDIYLTYVGSWYGVLAYVFTVIVFVDTTANLLYAIFNVPGSRRYGLLVWVALLCKGNLTAQLVTKELKVVPVRPAGPLARVFARMGVPGFVIIDNGVAAVFERSGKYTRVEGPGFTFLKRFERIAQVLDLRPQMRERRVQKIMTRDGLSFDLDRLDVLFTIAGDFDPQQGEYSYTKESLLDLVYRGGLLYDKGQEFEWGDRVAFSVEYYLRNVASQYTLTDLVRGDQMSARTRLLEEVEKLARPALRAYGVRLIGIDIGQIIVPEELRALLTLPLKQVVDMGWAHTQRDAIIGISEGLKQAIAKIQASMPEATKETRPHLLLNLTTILGRILEESLQLASSYREGPEGRNLLPGGGEAGGGSEHPGDIANIGGNLIMPPR